MAGKFTALRLLAKSLKGLWTVTKVGGVAAAGAAANEYSNKGGLTGAVQAETEKKAKSFQEVLDDMGIKFGVGSVIGAGALFAAGYFGLNSALLGAGLAVVGALAGESILTAVTKGNGTAVTPPATPGTSPKVETAAPVTAPTTEPEVTVELETQEPTSGLSPTARGETVDTKKKPAVSVSAP